VAQRLDATFDTARRSLPGVHGRYARTYRRTALSACYTSRRDESRPTPQDPIGSRRVKVDSDGPRERALSIVPVPQAFSVKLEVQQSAVRNVGIGVKSLYMATYVVTIDGATQRASDRSASSRRLSIIGDDGNQRSVSVTLHQGPQVLNNAACLPTNYGELPCSTQSSNSRSHSRGEGWVSNSRAGPRSMSKSRTISFEDSSDHPVRDRTQRRRNRGRVCHLIIRTTRSGDRTLQVPERCTPALQPGEGDLVAVRRPMGLAAGSRPTAPAFP
jgi:hypothetical protein